jgi:two-component system, NarL family, response regulator NreC
VVIADDHAVMRQGLSALMKADGAFRVVGEAGDVDSAIELVKQHAPTALVLDLQMPGSGALAAIGELTRLAPETAIVVLTMNDHPEFARQALRSGARAYVLKDAAWTEVLEALRQSVQGHTYVDPRMGARLAGREAPSAYVDLTDREREVLHLLARGHTNVQIAQLLFISLRTAESHRASIRRKLGTSDRSDLVDYVRAQGLLDPEGPIR